MNKENFENLLNSNKTYLVYDVEDNKKMEGVLIKNTKDSDMNFISKSDFQYLLETIDIQKHKLKEIGKEVFKLNNFFDSLNLSDSLCEEYDKKIFKIEYNLI